MKVIKMASVLEGLLKVKSSEAENIIKGAKGDDFVIFDRLLKDKILCVESEIVTQQKRIRAYIEKVLSTPLAEEVTPQNPGENEKVEQEMIRTDNELIKQHINDIVEFAESLVVDTRVSFTDTLEKSAELIKDLEAYNEQSTGITTEVRCAGLKERFGARRKAIRDHYGVLINEREALNEKQDKSFSDLWKRVGASFEKNYRPPLKDGIMLGTIMNKHSKDEKAVLAELNDTVDYHTGRYSNAFTAILWDFSAIIDILVGQPEFSESEFEETFGLTLLRCAINYSKPKMALHLIKTRKCENDLIQKKNNMTKLLRDACQKGYIDVAISMLTKFEMDCRPEQKDEQGVSAFDIAKSKGLTEVAELIDRMINTPTGSS